MGNLRVDMIYLYPRLPVERYYKSLCDLIDAAGSTFFLKKTISANIPTNRATEGYTSS